MLVDLFKNIEHVKKGEQPLDTPPDKLGDKNYILPWATWMLTIDGLRFSVGFIGSNYDNFDDWDGNPVSNSLNRSGDLIAYKIMDSI